ncbi:MAG: hypothetical protein R2857_08765 [Vampirovibrionales bacterium]
MRQTQTQAYKQKQAQAQRQLLADLRRRFQAARQRTDRLFDWVDASAYTQAGIPLRHPVVFYHGHFDAFLFNTVFKRVLKQASFHPAFDDLFERGIDPASLADADVHARSDWPDRATVAAYKTEVWQHLEALFDRLLVDDGALVASARLPLLQQALWMAYEHELMHQENAALYYSPASPTPINARLSLTRCPWRGRCPTLRFSRCLPVWPCWGPSPVTFRLCGTTSSGLRLWRSRRFRCKPTR